MSPLFIHKFNCWIDESFKRFNKIYGYRCARAIINKDIFTARARLYFHRRVWFCSRGRGGSGPRGGVSGPGGGLVPGGCPNFGGGGLQIFGGSPIFLGVSNFSGGHQKIFSSFFSIFSPTISSGMHQPTLPSPRRSIRGRYASYWNAFFLLYSATVRAGLWRLSLTLTLTNMDCVLCTVTLRQNSTYRIQHPVYSTEVPKVKRVQLNHTWNFITDASMKEDQFFSLLCSFRQKTFPKNRLAQDLWGSLDPPLIFYTLYSTIATKPFQKLVLLAYFCCFNYFFRDLFVFCGIKAVSFTVPGCYHTLNTRWQHVEVDKPFSFVTRGQAGLWAVTRQPPPGQIYVAQNTYNKATINSTDVQEWEQV